MARDFAESSTDNIDVGAALNPTTGQGTTCFWFYNKAQSSNNRYMFSNRSGTTGWFGRIDGNESLELLVTLGGGFITADATGNLSANAWHFLVWDFIEGTSAEVNIYANDMVTRVGSNDGNHGSYTDGTANLTIGNGLGGSFAADGRYAHFLTYDKQLTVEERLMAKTGKVPAFGNLLGYWPLYGNSTEPDLSGNGNNGTVTGATIADHAPVGRVVTMPRYRPIIALGGAPPAPTFTPRMVSF